MFITPSINYRQCFTCGRMHTDGIDDEYIGKLPDLYRDLVITDTEARPFVPYFYKSDTQQLFLDGSDIGSAEWVLVPLIEGELPSGVIGQKPDWEQAERVPISEFYSLFKKIVK